MRHIVFWWAAAKTVGLALVAGSLLAPAALAAGKCTDAVQELVNAVQTYNQKDQEYEAAKDALMNAARNGQMELGGPLSKAMMKALDEKMLAKAHWQGAYEKMKSTCSSYGKKRRNASKNYKP